MLSKGAPCDCSGSDCMLSEAKMHVFRIVAVTIPRSNAHLAWWIMTRERFLHCWPFVMGISPLPIDFSDQGPVMYSVHIFLFFLAWTSCWSNSGFAKVLQIISGVMMLMWRPGNGFWFRRMNSSPKLTSWCQRCHPEKYVDAEIRNNNRKNYLLTILPAFLSPLVSPRPW